MAQQAVDDPNAVTSQKPLPAPIKAPTAANTNPIPTSGATVQAPPMTPPAPAPATPAPQTLPNTSGQAQTPTIGPASPAPAQTFAQLSAATATPNFSTPYTGQPAGPTNDKGQPLGPDGQFHGAQGPTFTLGAGGQPSTVQQANGSWTNADGSGLAAGKDQFGNTLSTGPSLTPSSLSLPEMQKALDADKAANPSGIQPAPGAAPTPAPAAPQSPAIGPASQSLGGYMTSSGAAPSPAPAGTPNGVGLNQIDPNADLRGTSVLPTNQVDRTKLMNDRMTNYENTELPQYQARLRQAIQGNAALGRTGSGMLRTDVGNLDLAEQNALTSKFSDLASNATEGTIQDAANNRNEYRTERGYENGLENQAYDRGVQGLTLEDALTNSAFGRAQAQNNAGQAGNPSQTQLLLSSIFGDQANSAGSSLASLLKGNAASNVVNVGGAPASGGGNGSVADASSQIPAWLMQILKANGGGSTPPTDVSGQYGVAPN